MKWALNHPGFETEQLSELLVKHFCLSPRPNLPGEKVLTVFPTQKALFCLTAFTRAGYFV